MTMSRVRLAASLAAAAVLAAAAASASSAATPAARQARSRSAFPCRSPATSPTRARPLSTATSSGQNIVNAKGGILGRKVAAHHPDDTSSPTQAATNYQNFITKDKVALVFGPFSTLSTAPSARLPTGTATRSSSRPAAARRCSTRSCTTSSSRSLPRSSRCGDVFAKFILSLPKSQRPKTAAYPSLDDPFASPIADHVRSILEKAGVKTVYKTIYPSETADMTPIVAKSSARQPDAMIGGTQSDDAYAQVKAMVQLEVQPEVPVPHERAERPGRVPEQGRREERQRDLQRGDWSPRRRRRATRLRQGVSQGSTAAPPTTIDPARRRPTQSARSSRRSRRRPTRSTTRRSSRRSTRVRGRRWRELELERDRRAAGQRPAGRMDRREALPRLPKSVAQRCSPVVPKPGWGK